MNDEADETAMYTTMAGPPRVLPQVHTIVLAQSADIVMYPHTNHTGAAKGEVAESVGLRRDAG